MRQGGKQVHTSGPDQGCQIDSCPRAKRRAPTRWDRAPAPRSPQGADACSPGEVRAIRCPVAGRARKGVGGGTLRLQSTARVTLISAGHSMQGPGSDNPRAGRGSEG